VAKIYFATKELHDVSFRTSSTTKNKEVRGQSLNEVMKVKDKIHRGRRWPGKTAGGIGFALIPIAIGILWLLSFFQEKESNNVAIRTTLLEEACKMGIIYLYSLRQMHSTLSFSMNMSKQANPFCLYLLQPHF
jgi:hypothetical protein